VPVVSSPTSRATKVATTPEEIRRTIAENLVPGRMVFLDFVLDGGGMRMVAATGADGRAKSPGLLNSGLGWVHYDLFGADGALLQQGSVPDPTRQRYEFPADSNDGKIASRIVFAEQGPLAVRLPGELPIARIEFYRDRTPAGPGGALGREVLGTFDLRGPP
jgi:hypothetical protein